MSKVAKLFILPGNPNSKTLTGKNTRVFLASGEEVPHVWAMSVFANEPARYSAQKPMPQSFFAEVSLEMHNIKVVTVSKRPERKLK